MSRSVNEEWHRGHVLGSKAPMDRRVEWHVEHARECACRPIPASVLAEIARRRAAGTAEAAPTADGGGLARGGGSRQADGGSGGGRRPADRGGRQADGGSGVDVG